MKRRDEVLVGIFVTVAVAILIVGTIWLTRGGLSRGYSLYTHFAWGQGLKKGQPVLLAGVSVGYVNKVTLEPGYLDVELRVENDVRIPRGSKATVKPNGIFGDVAIALTPPMPLPTTTYVTGDTVPPGPSTPDIADIYMRVDSIGGSIARVMDSFEKDLIATGGLKDLRKTIALTTAFSAQMQTMAATQNANLTAMMAEFRSDAHRVAAGFDSTVVDSTVKNMRAISANAARLAAQVDSTNHQLQLLLADVNAGRGSVGLLLKDSTLYTNTRNMVARTDSLLTDFQKNPKKYLNVCVSVIRKCPP
jgi:phospholipid/cholesterol/gamma-HCH transport system substrate-binding protein